MTYPATVTEGFCSSENKNRVTFSRFLTYCDIMASVMGMSLSRGSYGGPPFSYTLVKSNGLSSTKILTMSIDVPDNGCVGDVTGCFMELKGKEKLRKQGEQFIDSIACAHQYLSDTKHSSE